MSQHEAEQLLIVPEAQAWEIHQENMGRGDALKAGLWVATVLAVFGEVAVGAVVHPAICGLIPFTIAASVYGYHRIEKKVDEEWLKIWLHPHRYGVGQHGETEAMLAQGAKPVNDSFRQLPGE